jgi:hypothetical protein
VLKRNNSLFYRSAYYRAFARLARNVLGEDFTRAESYVARDEICRMLAGECYELAQRFAQEGKHKCSLQYMRLSAKLLGMSLRPKKLSDLDEIKKTLARLNTEKAST